MFDVRVSTVDEFMQSGQSEALFAEHWEEIVTHREVTPLKPDMDFYRRLEPGGTLLLLTAWAEDRMVGYSFNFVTQSPHFGGLVTVTNDALFIARAYRQGTGLGLALLKATEKHGQAMGGKLMMWLAKPDTPLAKLMDHLGYTPQEIVFTKGM